jgi:hypothetical protein
MVTRAGGKVKACERGARVIECFSLNHGRVAQWQSSGLLSHWLSVRAAPRSLTFLSKFTLHHKIYIWNNLLRLNRLFLRSFTGFLLLLTFQPPYGNGKLPFLQALIHVWHGVFKFFWVPGLTARTSLQAILVRNASKTVLVLFGEN